MPFEEMIEHMPSWFFIIAAIIILVGLTIAVIIPILGVRRLVNSINKEQKLFELLEEKHTLSTENEYNKNKSLKLLTVIDNSRQFLNTINNNSDGDADVYMHIQRIIESLSADIKTKAGEKHRCGFWANTNNRSLILLNGSSGFPDYYIGRRALSLDSSIAGRCFRKKTLINSPNVKEDHDYEPSESDYSSLLCVPIASYGVLTIDGKEPFDKSAESVAELYASIIELTMTYLVASSYESVHSEIAATTNKEESE